MIDLAAIQPWLQLCAPCDAGLPTECTHPAGDYRAPMLALVREVERLRALRRPRLLDLCCCQGGAAKGYHDAGFDVTGIDTEPQPRYPFAFIRADAMEVLGDHRFLSTFDVVHASFPCQSYSPLAALSPHKTYPDLIEPGRALLRAWGGPWVIENVMAAPLDRARSIVLCGGMFGLRTYRHRRFEPSPGITLTAPPHPRHVAKSATRQRRERWQQGWHMSVTGGIGTYFGPAAMGIDWMDSYGLCEAIPPAYTRHIGGQLIDALAREAAA